MLRRILFTGVGVIAALAGLGTFLYARNATPTVPPIATADATAAGAPWVLKLHAQWCPICMLTKGMWSEIEETYAGRVRLAVFDFTDEATTAASRAEAERLGLLAVFEEVGFATGPILVLDGGSKDILAWINGSREFADYEAAIDAALASPLLAQSGSATGTVERIKVHSPAIAGNLQGNTADRDVLVYLPPSYASSPRRRYPVVYQLHGWLPGAEQWAGMLDFEAGTNRALASGEVKEMIVVVPDSLTVHGGSMYSTSVTSGDFEGFIARDLVAYVDGHYRTIAQRASRGLSGHSMGGYGTWRIAMKYPELYSSFYAMSSCCLGPYGAEGGGMAEAAQIKTLEQAAEAGIGVRVQLTLAAAWSPNPNKPPLYFDFPLANGAVDALVLTKWNANVPLAVIDQYVPNLRKYDAIGIEVGLQDGLIGVNKEISDVLTRYGIEHVYETYEGNHTNKVAERYETRVLPFFSRELAFE
jgi:enterochelin esterase-like enzyme